MISEQFTTTKDLSSHTHRSVRASEEHSPITYSLGASLLFSLSHTLPDFCETGGAGESVYLWAEEDDSCIFCKWQLKIEV